MLISAVATAAAAVVLKLIEPVAPPAAPEAAPDHGGGPYVDADTMTKEQQDLLLQELSAQI